MLDCVGAAAEPWAAELVAMEERHAAELEAPTARACTQHSHSRTSQSGPAVVEVGLETTHCGDHT